MKYNLFSKKSIATILSLVTVLSLLMVAATPAFAKSTDPVTGGTKASNAKITAMFHHGITTYSMVLKSSLFENNSIDSTLKYVQTREGKAGTRKGSFTPNQYTMLYSNLSHVGTLMGLIKNLIVLHPGFDRYYQVTNNAVAAETAREMDAYAISLQYYFNQASKGYSALQHTR